MMGLDGGGYGVVFNCWIGGVSGLGGGKISVSGISVYFLVDFSIHVSKLSSSGVD